MSSFYGYPKSAKRQSSHLCLFVLLGSKCAKAAHNMLAKSILGVFKLSLKTTFWSFSGVESLEVAGPGDKLFLILSTMLRPPAPAGKARWSCWDIGKTTGRISSFRWRGAPLAAGVDDHQSFLLAEAEVAGCSLLSYKIKWTINRIH